MAKDTNTFATAHASQAAVTNHTSRFTPPHLRDSLEGRQFIATRSGVQISADDGPTQVILPVPDRSRVTGVCLGGKDKDTLFAFCGNKIWKRKVQHHAMGAFTRWTKATGTNL